MKMFCGKFFEYYLLGIEKPRPVRVVRDKNGLTESLRLLVVAVYFQTILGMRYLCYGGF